MIKTNTLVGFLEESRSIEGINTPLPEAELVACGEFLDQDEINITTLTSLVQVLQPNAELRIRPGMNVQVGKYRPPSGGPSIEDRLSRDLRNPPRHEMGIYFEHHNYEQLHPFTDGNGRSGRLIWLHRMIRIGYNGELGFLHKWYYQSLAFSDLLD